MSLFRKKSYSKTSSSDSSSPSAPSEPPPETPSPAHPSSSRFFRSPSSPAVSSASSSPASTVGEGSASRNRRVSLKSLFSGSRKSFRRTPSTSGTSPLQVDRSSVGGSIVEPTGDSAHGRLRRSNSSSSAEEGGFGTVVEVGPGRIDEVSRESSIRPSASSHSSSFESSPFLKRGLDSPSRTISGFPFRDSLTLSREGRDFSRSDDLDSNSSSPLPSPSLHSPIDTSSPSHHIRVQSAPQHSNVPRRVPDESSLNPRTSRESLRSRKSSHSYAPSYKSPHFDLGKRASVASVEVDLVSASGSINTFGDVNRDSVGSFTSTARPHSPQPSKIPRSIPSPSSRQTLGRPFPSTPSPRPSSPSKTHHRRTSSSSTPSRIPIPTNSPRLSSPAHNSRASNPSSPPSKRTSINYSLPSPTSVSKRTSVNYSRPTSSLSESPTRPYASQALLQTLQASSAPRVRAKSPIREPEPKQEQEREGEAVSLLRKGSKLRKKRVGSVGSIESQGSSQLSTSRRSSVAAPKAGGEAAEESPGWDEAEREKTPAPSIEQGLGGGSVAEGHEELIKEASLGAPSSRPLPPPSPRHDSQPRDADSPPSPAPPSPRVLPDLDLVKPELTNTTPPPFLAICLPRPPTPTTDDANTIPPAPRTDQPAHPPSASTPISPVPAGLPHPPSSQAVPVLSTTTSLHSEPAPPSPVASRSPPSQPAISSPSLTSPKESHTTGPLISHAPASPSAGPLAFSGPFADPTPPSSDGSTPTTPATAQKPALAPLPIQFPPNSASTSSRDHDPFHFSGPFARLSEPSTPHPGADVSPFTASSLPAPSTPFSGSRATRPRRSSLTLVSLPNPLHPFLFLIPFSSLVPNRLVQSDLSISSSDVKWAGGKAGTLIKWGMGWWIIVPLRVAKYVFGLGTM